MSQRQSIHSNLNSDLLHSLKSRRPNPKSGLTLLEVILALAILGVSLAILSQAMHLAAENGLRAEKLNAAQMICDSKMAEVVSGLVSLQTATSYQPVTLSFSDTQWYYMIMQTPNTQTKMVRIEVIVTDDPQRTAERPIDVSMVRWIIDPTLGLDTLPTQNQTGTGSTSTGSTSGGTSNGGIQ